MDTTASVFTTIDDIGPEWDELMTAARAPVFYRRPFLRAFEHYPLHPVLRTAYILVRDGEGTLQSAQPAFLQRDVDPMQVIHTHYPQALPHTALLTHVWHCYDTVLPVRPGSEAIVPAAIDALRGAASDWGAALYGMANIDAASPLATSLGAAGLEAVDIEIGWSLDLRAVASFDTYLSGLRKKPRWNLVHDLRNADRAGLDVRIAGADDADLDGFVALARATAAKYDNADYYKPGLFQDFVHALGADMRAVELRLDGRLVGSSLALVDDTRFHYWAVGVDYAACPNFSPFYVAFGHVLRAAYASGRPRFEVGRRNPTFKRRYGLTSRTLRAYFGYV
jgi:predicted N-acyltransferase